MVAEWDRATRSMWDGFKIMIRIADRGAALKVLDKPVLDLTTPSGRGLLVLLSSLAEEERQRIVQRAADGRKAAKGAYLENPCSDYSTPTVARCARWAWRGENNRRKYQIQIGRVHRALTHNKYKTNVSHKISFATYAVSGLAEFAAVHNNLFVVMSALPPTADIPVRRLDFRF